MKEYIFNNYGTIILYFLITIIAFYIAILIFQVESFNENKECYDYYISTGVKLKSCKWWFK